MKIFTPDNVYFRVIQSALKNEEGLQFSSIPAAMLSSRLINGDCDAAFLPALDLIKGDELYISRRVGVSLGFVISNSFLYFNDKSSKIDELTFFGDVSSTDILTAKILFSENYHLHPNMTLAKAFPKDSPTIILVGDINLIADSFEKGINFNEEMADLLGFPITSYVLAGLNKEVVLKAEQYFEEAEIVIDSLADTILDSENYSTKVKNMLKANLHELTLKLREEHIEGILHLTRMPYFYGIIEDIPEINFAD